ncbi:MAG: N-acetylmuramoyl-L-alanine amidase [Nitrospinota bacterium]|nr:N-acetylmuramoyl-L-alanine amidase [Nitrospinota bacterium]
MSLYKKLFLLFCFHLAILAYVPDSFAAKPSAETLYQNARSDYYSLLASHSRIQKRREWLGVIGKFNIVSKNHRKTKRGADALYTQGLIYENMYKRFNVSSDGKKAVQVFLDVTKKYPSSPLVDDAERHIGDISFMQRKDRNAAKRYSTVHKRSRAKTGGVNTSTQKSPGVRITNITRFSHDGYSRFVIHLSGKTAFRANRLTKPDRVFVDFLLASPGGRVSKTSFFKSGLVKSIRFGKSYKSTRVVFDLKKNAYHSITPLSNPYRLVVDFGLKPPSGKSVSARKSKPPRNRNRRVASIAPVTGGRAIKTIVIDAGHGGRDPGAIGARGMKEKDVTLALAKKLRARLQRKLRCKIVLTRDRDKTLALDDRTVLANSVNADLFISIHTNSSKNRRARGIETYFLSPARSQDELETAARENMIANFSENPADNDIAYIMSDMANSQKINESVMLARKVQKAMVKGVSPVANTRDKGVKQAMFYVLWRAEMPSILVEANFISNRYEEKLLRNGKYLDRLAESISNGVMEYVSSYQVAMKK